MGPKNQLVFGMDKLTIRDADSMALYGILAVVGSIAVTPTVEMVSNNKGLGRTWDIRAGASSVEGTLSFDQQPLWIYDAFTDSSRTTGKALIGKAGAVTSNPTQPDFFGKVIVTAATPANSVTITVHNLLDLSQEPIVKIVLAEPVAAIALGSSAAVFGFTLAADESFSIGDEFYIQSIAGSADENGAQTFSGIETPPQLLITATAQNESRQGVNTLILHRGISSAFATGFTQNAFQELEVPLMLVYDDAAGGYFTQIKSQQVA